MPSPSASRARSGDHRWQRDDAGGKCSDPGPYPARGLRQGVPGVVSSQSGSLLTDTPATQKSPASRGFFFVNELPDRAVCDAGSVRHLRALFARRRVGHEFRDLVDHNLKRLAAVDRRWRIAPMFKPFPARLHLVPRRFGLM
jgi:hypothetical protein